MTSVLVCTIGTSACALPLGAVIETMRPLPVESFARAPRGVLGVAVIRGAPTLVIDGAALLGESGGPHRRYVTLRAGHRVIALAVQAVEGIQELAADVLHDLPRLLRDEATIASIGTRDHEVLIVLQASRLLPDRVQEGT